MLYKKPKEELEALLKNYKIEEKDHRMDMFKLNALVTDPQGMITEFGVHAGSSLREIIEAYPDRETYGFDVFHKPMPDDFTEKIPKGVFVLGIPVPVFTEPNVKIIEGYYENTLPQFLNEHSGNFAFIHMDSDIYISTKYVLATLLEAGRIIPGTVIQFDELFYLENDSWYWGEYKALEECTKEYGLEYKYLNKKEHHVAIVVTGIGEK